MDCFERDLFKSATCYREAYVKYGYSPKSLKWDKGKQDIRYDILTSQYDFTDKTVLDIGCGFGDLNKILTKFSHYTYYGIDLLDEFIHEARIRYEKENVKFDVGNIISLDATQKFDYAIASGIFNYRFTNSDNYQYIEEVMQKTFSAINDGLAFDFLSNRVDYQLQETFHSDPAVILSMAYKLTRNIVLRNDYMPFEFSIFLFKDASYEKHDTLFNRYKELHFERL